MIDPTSSVEVIAEGLNASPGAATGAIVLDADTAEDRGRAGEDVISCGGRRPPTTSTG